MRIMQPTPGDRARGEPDDLEARIALLREIPLFASLDDHQLTALEREFRVRRYRKGEILFHQGDQSGGLYLVFYGRVRIYRLSPAGEETTVDILTRRGVIGEFSVIDGRQRSATAKAVTPAVLLEITRSRLLRCLEEVPRFAWAMCRLLVGKARWASVYAEAIARLGASDRLLHLLLCYNERYGCEVEPGRVYTLDLGLNQEELASLIGARRQCVNRILQDWRKRGLMTFDEGVITFTDLPAAMAQRDRQPGDRAGAVPG